MGEEFADRLHWARIKANKGAPTLAKEVGCSPSLISNIENNGARSSQLNDLFAKALKVSAAWLRDGVPPIPKGFDPIEAREMRKEKRYRVHPSVVQLPDYQAPTATPEWAEEAQTPARNAAHLQKRIYADFHDYVRIVGQEEAQKFISALSAMMKIVPHAT